MHSASLSGEVAGGSHQVQDSPKCQTWGLIWLMLTWKIPSEMLVKFDSLVRREDDGSEIPKTLLLSASLLPPASALPALPSLTQACSSWAHPPRDALSLTDR